MVRAMHVTPGASAGLARPLDEQLAPNCRKVSSRRIKDWIDRSLGGRYTDLAGQGR